MSTPQEQYLRAKCEVEASLAGARALCEQWQTAMSDNPRNLTKKDIDQLSKQFKNKLLTVKWDCEDLEEIVNISEYDANKTDPTDLSVCRDFIRDSRYEISQLMEKLGEGDTKTKLFSKHGITFSNPSQAAAAILSQNVSAKYERLTTNDTDVVEFDIATAATNSNHHTTDNPLYEKDHSHHGSTDEQRDNNTIHNNNNNQSNATMNIHINPNDSQLMLDMLETEFYNPHHQMPSRTSRLDYALRKFLESADRTKLFGVIAFMCSIPIILLLCIL